MDKIVFINPLVKSGMVKGLFFFFFTFITALTALVIILSYKMSAVELSVLGSVPSNAGKLQFSVLFLIGINLLIIALGVYFWLTLKKQKLELSVQGFIYQTLRKSYSVKWGEIHEMRWLNSEKTLPKVRIRTAEEEIKIPVILLDAQQNMENLSLKDLQLKPEDSWIPYFRHYVADNRIIFDES